jgi:hypothetical protein
MIIITKPPKREVITRSIQPITSLRLISALSKNNIEIYAYNVHTRASHLYEVKT